MRRLGYAALFLCFFATAAPADQVTLKNGDRLTGTIVKTDEKVEALLVKTEFAGDVTVKWDAVASLVSSEPLHFTLKDGQAFAGTVTMADGSFTVATKT